MFKETGVGWDPNKGNITGDDAWWEKNLQAGDKYKRFRKKGVDPELSDLWDTIFGSIVATGRHCVAATMDPSAVEVLGSDNDDEAEEDDESEPKQLVDATAVNLVGSYENVQQSAHDSIMRA